METNLPANSSVEMPVKSSPKDFFAHLLAFGALYVSVVSFIALLWAYIEALFPDRLGFYYEGGLSQIRWASSVLVVVFAVYILLSWLIGREYQAIPEKREIRVRRWLVYLTLFVAAVTIIVDLVTLLYEFYSGDYSLQFILKVLVVLITAGAGFLYYFLDLRRKDFASKAILGWIVSLVVLVAVAGGFFIVGSPATQRARRFDEQRVGDLQNIQYRLINFWQNKNTLPNRLEELRDDISGFMLPKDPQTDQPYEYKLISQDGRVFQLCAVFVTNSNTPGGLVKVSSPDYPNAVFPDNWDHPAGRYCFQRTVDPQLYPPRKL